MSNEKKDVIIDFNEKVISILRSKDDSGNPYRVAGINLGDPNIAVTQIMINNVPSLVVVSLNSDTSIPLADRVENIMLVLHLPDIDSVNRMHNWLSYINNVFTNEAISGLGESQLKSNNIIN